MRLRHLGLCLLIFTHVLHAGDSTEITGSPAAAPEITTPSAAVPETPGEPAATVPADNAELGKSYGVLGSESWLLVGPAITALGIPSPFRVGVEAKWKNRYGFSLDYGFVPQYSVDGIAVRLNAWTATARYYLWDRAFFVGLGLGKQRFTGSMTTALNGTDVTMDVAVNSIVIAPQVGWRWVYPSGFYLGMTLGIQVPLSNQIDITSNATAAQSVLSAYAQIYTDIDSAAKYARYPLPQFALIQLGFFF